LFISNSAPILLSQTVIPVEDMKKTCYAIKMKIEENVSLKDKNWFCTGGKARFFCRPQNEHEFQQSLLWALKHKVKAAVLGEGANVLVSDDGFDGLIICPMMRKISLSFNQDKNFITADAGVNIQDCIDWCIDNSSLGLEEFSGIPGTIGGAVYINIHYFQFFLSQFLEQATLINTQTGEIKSFDNAWFNFGYDKSKLQEKEWLLLSATFALKPATDIQAAYAAGRRDEIIRHRNSRYPKEKTCGCFFKNFDKTQPPIAYLFDKLGFRGELKHGGAIVSSRHANMIINQDNATSSDIITLARIMQEKTLEVFGLLPQAECQFIGFDDCPLLKTIPKNRSSSNTVRLE
jgi:UDP-N-acetylmuramate dehydrogenase